MAANLIGPFVLIAAGLAGVRWPWLLAGLLALHIPLFGGMMIPSCQWLGPVVTRFEPKGREVWITIDDGPDPEDTPELLRQLKEARARATFFWIGENAARHPDLVKAARADGHEIACHTMTHPSGSFWAAGPTRTRREIEAADRVLGKGARFRAPAGLKNPWLHGILGKNRAVVAWSARGLDGFGGRAEAALERLIPGLEPGGILLFHEGRVDTEGRRLAPQILRGLLEACRARGLQPIVPPCRSS